MKNLSWRLYSVLAVILIAIVYILPTMQIDVWPHKKINYGLDLQGGMHLVLEVQTQEAVVRTIEYTSQEMRTLLKDENIKHKGIVKLGNEDTFSVKFEKVENADKFKNFISDKYSILKINSETTRDGLMVFNLGLTDLESEQVQKLAVDQALEKIRNRVDTLGLTEPDIRRQGEKRILLQLPGVQDPDRVKSILQTTALLEFKLVDDQHDLQAALNGKVPAGSQVLYEIKKDKITGKETGRIPYLIKKRTLLTGTNLADARVQFDSRQFNQPYVAIAFNSKGSKTFARITKEYINKRLAIVLDGKVYSAPTIQSEIIGGRAQITGQFTQDEARDLAIILRAGSLPASVDVLEERTVGPTLGQDSIDKGLMSMLVGGLLVIVFMVIYYKGAGLIADLALVANILLIGAGLAAFQATLTLPGIAGIILTIGMAVDANVLIFERIREELRFGRSPKAAISAGFDRATLTILDANVTTLIVALVLFQFGTGPVKGFAVTLSLGIISSLFTALVVSKLIFDTVTNGKDVKTLSI